MKVRVLVLACFLALSSTADAVEPGVQERAAVHAERITDVNAYLAEVGDSLRMARDGSYGKIKRSEMSRLETAQNRIKGLLEGRSSGQELSPDDRVALYQAQEMISSILGKDKNRVVCKRTTKLGSRLPINECLTVGQREQLAKDARENTDRTQRNVCYAGEGQSCL